MEVKLEDIDTPFLWVDLDIMEDNISSLSSFFKSKNLNWRPHVKGIKTPEIAQKIINSGAIGVTCAKLSEAEVMVSGGVESILIANQIVGSKKIERLCALSNDAEIITAVDDAGVVQMMNQIAQQKSVNLNVLIEINIGMNRAGITQIKGHTFCPGLRFSIYNAMPVEGVSYLTQFMRKFMLAHPGPSGASPKM